MRCVNRVNEDFRLRFTDEPSKTAQCSAMRCGAADHFISFEGATSACRAPAAADAKTRREENTAVRIAAA